jgi:hypothetical protein
MTVVPSNVAGWRLEARGTEGTLVASTSIMPQISPVTLTGAKGDDELAPIPTRDEFVAVPDAPLGPPRNVSESYARLAKAISDGSRYRADFDDALALHRWLDEIRGVS